MIYERRINYYETDSMKVVHHSNYIRFLEEARCYMLDEMGIPYKKIEEEGLMIPVLGVKFEYKYPAKYDDIIQIEVKYKEFNGVRMTMEYIITNKQTGNVVGNGETRHCFTNAEMRPIQLKKVKPEWYDIFMKYV